MSEESDLITCLEWLNTHPDSELIVCRVLDLQITLLVLPLVQSDLLRKKVPIDLNLELDLVARRAYSFEGVEFFLLRLLHCVERSLFHLRLQVKLQLFLL